jgi:hypothetical protein
MERGGGGVIKSEETTGAASFLKKPPFLSPEAVSEGSGMLVVPYTNFLVPGSKITDTK